MPINVVDHPVTPQCSGKQWHVIDDDLLAKYIALVLIGLVRHVEHVIEGAQRRSRLSIAPALKERLQADLFPPAGIDPWHRDGLLFEIICWLVARMNASPGEVISTPHTQSTQQGADTIKVAFNIQERYRTCNNLRVQMYRKCAQAL